MPSRRINRSVSLSQHPRPRARPKTMKGPSRKEETQQKSATLLSYGKDFTKAKCKSPSIPTSFDEAKASCKARKRKERQESISSLCQERKVIRSNSEERPTQKKYTENKSIRRVSSSEDFHKSDSKTVTITQFPEKHVSPNRQSSDIVLIYDDCEHERRRSHERFSKPLTFKHDKSRKSRRPKIRYLSKPKFKPEIQDEGGKNEKVQETKPDEVEVKVESFLQLHIQEKERSPSPVNQFSPDIDLSTLHEQVDCSEPLLSCANHHIDEDTETLPGLSVASNRLLSSPRNSIIATHRIYLDPDIQQASPGLGIENKAQNPLELRLQKVNKQVNSLKKKIRDFEAEYEAQHGCKVSHADKLNDKGVRKMYMDLSKLKKEQKHLNEVCPNISGDGEEVKTSKNIQDTYTELEKRLDQKREARNRPTDLEEMTNDQLIDEKASLQKALLYLESIHGRPNSREKRVIVRPLYDRYRNLKRMIARIPIPSTGNELETIHEDETMCFTASGTPPQTTIDVGRPLVADVDKFDDNVVDANLHSLSKEELLEQQKIVFEEKKELKYSIKAFEWEVQHRLGRVVQKEDKASIQHVYSAYKKIKAKLKLLDALVAKLE